VIGQNTLQLNEATLIEALQEYIDKRMGSYAPKVTGVKMGSSGSYLKTFAVKTDDKPDPVAHAADRSLVGNESRPARLHGGMECSRARTAESGTPLGAT
jgi:hypothetical protein